MINVFKIKILIKVNENHMILFFKKSKQLAKKVS